MDDAFGNWLAGFIDGEGHFAIRHDRSGHSSCAFMLALRYDDASILHEIHDRTGLGTLGMRIPSSRSAQQAVWRVSSKEHCRLLVETLTAYPLRAKKANDFRTWAQAVEHWHTAPADREAARRTWASLKLALETGRRAGYGACPQDAPTPPPRQAGTGVLLP